MSSNFANRVARHYQAHSINALEVAREWDLSPAAFSVLKYLQRAGLKSGEPRTKDMLKAVWYMVYETASQTFEHDAAQKLADDVADLILQACPDCLYPKSIDAKQDSSSCQCGSDCPSPGAYCSPGG